jgi:peptide chain release factor 3
MRNIPIIVFINKLDREGKDAFDLLDDVEQKLGLTTVPLSFPIGMGYDFQGIYNLWNDNIRLFEGEQKTTISQSNLIENINDPALETAIGASAKETLEEELELVREVYPSFDRKGLFGRNAAPRILWICAEQFWCTRIIRLLCRNSPLTPSESQ